MEITAARAPSPQTRRAGAATAPTLAIYFNTGATNDSLTARQAQRLMEAFSLPEPRARLIAGLAFGGPEA